ncbi:hypothetical protein FE257_003128 [Aspergillus nanangensis]|uniref:CBM21 domain-containing protein n=1 Tax=Aspergillus nanangensis TaxID=2582783 RepID=A0AAD4CBW9_ASPNN|nr:hypothetical protein FE257_003128 [Aspergillus nanangensis]
MPYTAPSKQSPLAQHVENSEPDTWSCPTSPTLPLGKRPQLSRPYSSTAYVRRHRRGSSNSKPLATSPPDNLPKSKHAINLHGSIRQSPPPISEARIPPGAMISPPESAPNSSDEESSFRNREGLHLEELEAAVRSIEQRRTSSPERRSSEVKPSSSLTKPSANGQRSPHPPLSKEARKISHSRSSTETAIIHKQEEALTSSPEESDRDDEPKRRIPMVRKKSGELVRPALRPPSARRRPSSMPGTPTYSKAVHFDSQLEHIRHFLQLDKPQAVSTGTSPVDDHNGEGEFPFTENGPERVSSEWDIRLPNFPCNTAARTLQRVRLERLFLSSDKTMLVGMVAVANLAFHKTVAARFTLDHWKTISEVTAEFNDDVRRKQLHDGYDRFSFSIQLDEQPNLEKKTMLICIRYSVNGQEYWDNNNSMNYQVNFLKSPISSPGIPRLAAKPPTPTRAPLPRSRTFASFGSRPHSMPASFDDFASMDDYLSFGHPPKDPKDRSLRGVHAQDDDTVTPIRREKPSPQAFGNRYDFETSLSAAMRSKTLHDRTTLTARAKSSGNVMDSKNQAPLNETDLTVGKPTASRERGRETSPDSSKPSSLISSKPHRESPSYQELVDKYCFYGSSDAVHGSKSPATMAKDGTSPRSTSSDSSGTNSPSRSPGGTRNASSSPNRFNYTYFDHIQHKFLKEAHTPTVIRG